MSIDKLTKEEILERVKRDKKALLAEKVEKVKFTDSLACNVTIPKGKKKADPPNGISKDSLDVVVVCNSSWFMDSQGDVLTDTSYDNSIAKKGNSIPHIADHKQVSVGHVGDVQKVYTKDIPLKELGYPSKGSTTSLIMETTIRKDYNEDVFKFYNNGKINQHSIGLKYVDIQLAINSTAEEDKTEYAVWQEGYPNIINKDLADKRGYFWLVKEIDIIENSCVLFGANGLTPTLEVKSDAIITQPSNLKNKGDTMTLEEALAKNLELTSQLAELKAERDLAAKQSAKEEQARILGVLKAADTLHLDSEIAIKRIKAGTSVEDATSLFEDIAEAVQKAGMVETSEPVTSTINSKTTEQPEESFMGSLEKAMDDLDKQDKSVTWGVK